MKLKRFYFLLFFLASLYSYAQVDYSANAYSMSMSGSTVAASGYYSLSENQGGLANCRQSSFFCDYSNRYLLDDLATRSLGYIMPLGNKTSAGLSLTYFGDRALNESCYSMAFGRQLYPWLSAGIKMNYHYLFIEAIDRRASAVTGELGIMTYPANGFCIGLYVKNPSKSRYVALNSDQLYSGLKAGFSYYEDKLYNITTQYNWENFANGNLAIAGEYWILEAFILRAGLKIRQNPSWSFGTGFNYNRFHLDLGFEHHTVLGLSAAVSIIYQLKGDAK